MRCRNWLICLLMLLCLSGCYLKTGEELYSLPQPPEDYLDLQNALSAVLDEGAEYAAPVSGANRQSVQLVDLNADGEINNRDLVLLQQHLNGWDVTIDIAVCDVTADGEINNRDLVLLQQYLNGWDVELG